MENQQKALQASLRAENAGNTTVAAQLAEMASPEARPRMNLREKAQRAQRAPGAPGRLGSGSSARISKRVLPGLPLPPLGI